MKADRQPSSFVATVREAIRGTHQDLTAIPIRTAVILLAVPTVLEMSMESLLTVVDIFFVTKLGSTAVATVGLTETMLSLVYALAMGLSAGATAIVSRRTGEKDQDGASHSAAQAIWASVLVATVVGIGGALFAPRLLDAMGASAEVVREGGAYARIMLGGNITIFLLFVVNAIFRSAGDAAVAMRALWVANILNMALAPCFIFGLAFFPKLGVTGAAVATTASRAVGVAYQMWSLTRASSRLAVRLRHFVPSPKVMGELLRLAYTAALQVLIETASWLGLVRILSTYGSDALAGYTIAMRIAVFAMLPSWGLATAAATLVGQNLGAKAPERAEASVRTVALYNMIFLGSVSLLFVAAPGAVVALFSPEHAAGDFATACLRIVAFGFVFFAFGMVAVQSFNGAGDTVTPMLVNLGCFWFIKIPLAYFLAQVVKMGPTGVFLAITVAYCVQATTAGLLFRRGKWKRATIDS
jgi:putative MATE family efflux protein